MTVKKWLVPDVIDPAETVCVQIVIPKDTKHIAAFWGALEQLGQAYNWEDSYVDGSQTAYIWQAILANSADMVRTGDNCMADCDNVLDCIEDDPIQIAMTGYQLNVIVSDSQDRDTLLNADYDNTPQSIGADIPVGVPDAVEQNALCYAIDKFVNFYSVSKRAQISRASGLRVALDEIQSAAIDFYNFIAPYVTPTYLSDLFGCFVSFETAFTALADQSARDEFACCLIGELVGVAMSEAAFNSAISACAASLSGTAEDIACIFEGDNDLTVFLVYLSGYQIALERQDDGDDLECTCLAWCYKFDFLTTNGAWANMAPYARPFGVWVNAKGWVSVWGNVNGNDERLYYYRTFTEVYVTDIRYTFLAVGTGGSTRNCTVWAYKNNSLVDSEVLALYDTDGSDQIIFFTVDALIDEIRITTVGNASADGNLEIVGTEVKVEGSGFNPFGTDNC